MQSASIDMNFFIECAITFFAKFSLGHRLTMDNAPSHTCNFTKRFMNLKEINHFPTAAQSSVRNLFKFLMPIELVLTDLKYFLCTVTTKNSV